MGLARGAAAVGDRSSVRLDVLLSYYSNDLFTVAADRLPGRRRQQRRGAAVRYPRLLDGADHLRDPGHHLHQPGDARHVPDPAVHHALAGVADRPADRRLARRPRLLPRPGSPTPTSTTPTSASSRTSTSSPPAWARSPNTPIIGSSRHAAVRRDQLADVGGLVHRDSVEPVRTADGGRHRRSATRCSGSVLVYVLFATVDRVLDRPSADPAELPQRADQRRVPLRPGAAARRRRGGRLLPRRGRRARPAAPQVRRDHHQLPPLREPDHRASPAGT